MNVFRPQTGRLIKPQPKIILLGKLFVGARTIEQNGNQG